MGTNFVASTKELCKIITICSKLNVSEIKIGELHLVFGSGGGPDQSNTRRVDVKSIEQASEKIQAETAEKNLASRIEEDLEELSLTDPFAHEQLLGGMLADVGKTP